MLKLQLEEIKQDKDRLEIFTLGQFLVKRGDRLLTENAARSYQLWRLFKYLFSYRGKSTDELMENLYPEEEPTNPERTLRNLVYRLRRLLSSGAPSGTEFQYITLSQGLYYFNQSSNYWLDTDEFKLLCSEAGRISSRDPARAIELYQKVLVLYHGYYLPETLYDDWVIPMRNYYHRLYLESVYDYIDLLKRAGRYPELREICEKTFLIDPYQENLHICFIDVLLEEGRTDLAKAHYNYASSLLYRDAGLKPSVAMRELYKKITSEKSPQVDERLSFPRNGPGGASEVSRSYLCDPETFLKFYRWEESKAERNGQPVFWCCLSLASFDDKMPDIGKRDEAMDYLENVLRTNLRKGDIVCRWNENQFYLMMPCLNHEQARKSLERIKQHCLHAKFKGLALQSSIKQLQAMQVELPQPLKTFA